jgi:histidinol-phosphate/aromatic aminotransferase/cobyric acid decarboxylase-like protein
VTMPPEPRPELVGLPAATHGGSPDPRVLDFSTGVSPLPAPEELLAAIAGADLSRYPHPTALPVRQALAALHDEPPERIVAGAGSVELIWAVARAFAGPGRAGLVVTPAFGEYAQALRSSGATVVPVEMAAPRFALPVPALEQALGSASPAIDVAFICRPSNPCLTAAPAADLVALGARWPRTLFVVDEAYLPMFDGLEGVRPSANIAVLRSLTKVFALPGLRLGYLLASAPVAAAIQSALPPWNVSGPAQAAGPVAARLLPLHAGPSRRHIGALRAALADRLAPLAGPPEQAGGPFLLYRSARAPALVERLRARGVLVRHGASFGLPHHIRLGVRPADEQERLVSAWRDSARDAPGGFGEGSVPDSVGPG